MKSKRVINNLAPLSVLLASVALAADMPTGAPNQTAQLDLLLMPSDVAIASDGQTYVVDGGNHQVVAPRAKSGSPTRATSAS
jgi:hypothetical protein